MVIEIPNLKLESEANKRGHWASRARRVKAQRASVRYAMFAQGFQSWLRDNAGPIEITIIRMGPRRLDDDNATISAKAIRDEIASCIGVDDGDCERATYVVKQQSGKYGVRIQFARRAPQEKVA